MRATRVQQDFLRNTLGAKASDRHHLFKQLPMNIRCLRKRSKTQSLIYRTRKILSEWPLSN